MNVSGQLVIKRLVRAIGKARENASELEKSLRETEVRSQELLEKRGNAILDLAKHYLPELNREAIHKTFQEVQGNLLQVVERKESRYTQIESRYERLLARQDEVQNRKEELTDDILKNSALLSSKEQAVSKSLQSNETFQKMTRTALQTEERLARNESRLEEIKRDAKEKLPDYEKSSLFQYLLRSDYGTTKYSGKGWTRRWDRWVARKINFGSLKQSYDFLKTTPKLMEEEIDRRKEEFHSLMQPIEDFQKHEAEKEGIPALVSQTHELKEQFEESSREWERIEDDLKRLDKDFQDLEESEESFYGEAVSRFKSFLTKSELEVLEARAKKTEEKMDDRIVEDIAWFSQQIEELKPKLEQIALNRQRFSQEIDGLDYVIRRTGQSEMSTERAEFSKAFDVNELVEQHSREVLSKEQFWETLKGEMILKPNWASKTADGITEVLDSPGSRMLGNALSGVATKALKEAVRRGMLRRR